MMKGCLRNAEYVRSMKRFSEGKYTSHMDNRGCTCSLVHDEILISWFLGGLALSQQGSMVMVYAPIQEWLTFQNGTL